MTQALNAASLALAPCGAHHAVQQNHRGGGGGDGTDHGDECGQRIDGDEPEQHRGQAP